MAQFDNIKCPTCGREYSGLLSTCPYCELGLDATTSLPKLTKDDVDTKPAAAEEEESVIVWPDPVEPERPAAAQSQNVYDFEQEADSEAAAAAASQAAAEQRRQAAASADTVKNVQVARQKKETEEKKKSTVSGWVTGIVCVILAIAVLIGVFLMLRSMGIFSSSDESDTAETATLPISSTPSETDETEETGDSTIVVSTETESEEAESEEVVWPSDEEEETDTDAVSEAETEAEADADSTTETEVIAEDNEPATETVSVDCDSISINYSDVSLFNIGETVSISATTVPASASDYVTWMSSDIAVCTVDDDGTVTAVNGGTATITATCGDQTATCIIRCSFEEVDADELFVLSSTDITLFYPGEQAQLTITSLDADSDLIDWESSDPSIATVSDGLVTAVGNGTATVTATLNSGSVDGQTLTCIVRCSLADSDDDDVSITGIYSLSTYDATLTADGEYFQLTISSEESDTIPSHTWTSGDTDVVYVDEFGVVYAVGNGTTTVSTTVDGQYLQCIVRVNIAD